MSISFHARPLRWAVRWLIIAGLLLLPLGIPAVPGGTGSSGGAEAAPSAKIDPAVLQAAERSPDGQAYALVYFKEQADLSFAERIQDWNERGWAVYRALKEVADRTQAEVLAGLASRKAEGAVADYYSYWIVNLVTVRADVDTLRWLASRPEVAYIYPELKIEAPKPLPADPEPQAPGTIEWNITKIRAPEVWSTYNITGTGAVVANVDTGVDYTHPALVRQYRGNLGGGTFDHNYNWWDADQGLSAPYDPDSHGTHTMGTQVGEDATQTNQIGVAPGAKWIAALGCCPDNDALLSSEQFMIAPWDLNGQNPDPSKRPHVVSNSWGGPGGSLIFNGVIAAQRAAGVFPTFSAGNSGPGCATLGSPGDNPAVGTSVAATTSADNIAGFSSRGPNPFGGTGPDVAAPGVSVRSSVPGGGYAVFSGTSMASPHVGGAVALIISAEPMMAGKVNQLEELLKQTAQRILISPAQTCGGVSSNTFPNNAVGWGRIDVKTAVDMVWHAGTISGQVTSGSQPIQGATVSISRQIGTRVITLTQATDADGNYSFVAGEGTYNIWVTAYGYEPTTPSSVSVTQGQNTPRDFNLTAKPIYTLSGTVTEGGSIPLYGKVEALGVPVLPVRTNPTTGQYSLSLAQGTYTIRASSEPGYAPVTATVVLNSNMTQDFSLTPRADYACYDNLHPGGPSYEWIDARGAYTYTLGDEGTVRLNLPAPFLFYGNPVSTAYASSNGFIVFDQNWAGANMMIPFIGLPNKTIYGLVEDLNPANGTQGVILTETLTVNNQQLFVVEWYQVEHWASGYPETFEIILNLTDNTIKVQYETVSWPDFTTAGVESPLVAGSTYATVYSYANSARLGNGRAVLYKPVTGRLPSLLDYFACSPVQLYLPIIMR